MAIATKDKFTFDEFIHELDEMDRIAADAPIARDMQDQIAEIIYDGIRLNFALSQDAWGNTWAPHAPLTIALYGVHPILILSSKMVTAATNTGAPGNVVEVSDRSFMVGVDIDYAAQQQFGSVAKNIPPRPFFDPSQETIDRLSVLAADYFEHEVVG